MGIALAAASLTIPPLIYASDTQPFGVILGYISFNVALTLLYWTFAVPTDRQQASVLEVLTSYISHSAYGVRKGYAKFQRSLGAHHDNGSDVHQTHREHAMPGAASPAGAETAGASGTAVGKGAAAATAQAGVEHHTKDASVTYSYVDTGPWPMTVFRAVDALLRVSVIYDVTFFVLCKVNPSWCDPVISTSMGAFASVHKAAAAAAGKGALVRAFVQIAAYLRLCLRCFAPFLLLILAIDIGYCWINLAVHVAATVLPEPRPFARQLPYHALQRPWAALSLRDYWGFRWQQFARFYFEHLGYPVVNMLLPHTAHPALRASLHTAAAFLITALTHEYMNWAAFGSYSGSYFLFFGVHCLAVLTEGWSSFVIGPVVRKVWQARRVQPNAQGHAQAGGQAGSVGQAEGQAGRVGQARGQVGPAKGQSVRVERRKALLVKLLQHTWVWSVLVLASPMFFEPMRAGGFFSVGAYYPFGKPLVPRLLAWLGAQEYGQLAFASDWLEAAWPAAASD